MDPTSPMENIGFELKNNLGQQDGETVPPSEVTEAFTEETNIDSSSSNGIENTNEKDSVAADLHREGSRLITNTSQFITQDITQFLDGDTLSEILIRGAREGNLALCERVMSFSDSARHVNELDDEGLTALHYAARSPTGAKICEFLVKHGADPLKKGEEGIIPLHLAAKSCNADVLAILLQGLKKRHLSIADNYGSTALHYAVMKKNENVCVEMLLKAGAPTTAADDQLLTPLHVSCSYGMNKSTEVLLQHGADMLAKDIDGSTPVHSAASGGYTVVLRRLFKHAKDKLQEVLDARDDQGNSPLHVAVEHQFHRATDVLLRQGANPEAKNVDGQTPLHVAARGTQTKIVKSLLHHNAKINAQDIQLMTPLHRAALFDRCDVIKVLLDKKAPLDVMDNDGFTPLLCACWKGHVDAAKLLIENGASLIHADKTGRNALMWAIAENNEKAVALILSKAKSSKGALRVRDRYNNSALHLAVETGSRRMVMGLLDTSEARYFLKSVNDEEQTALHVAARAGNTAIGSAIAKGNPALIDTGDFEKNAPLHIAASNGHRNFVHMLLDKGAPIDDRNDLRWTALDCAAHYGRVGVVDELLDRGAPIDTIDNQEMTPLHLASRRGHVAVVKMLMERRASLKATNADGHNALDIAILHGQMDVARAIINHSRWEEALQCECKEGLTPLKRMILYLPEAAEAVLDRCRADNGEPEDSPDYRVTFIWKYIDEEFDSTFKSNVETTPLWLMQKHNRGALLAHPVVEALMFYKHKRFGALVYYLNALFYGAFLFFLTDFILSVPVRIGQKATLGSFETITQYIAFIFPVFRIVLEILQMIFDGRKYFSDPINLLEWGVFSTATAFFIPFFLGLDQSIAQWSSGAVAIFLAWVNVIVIMRRVDLFGIYVLMFEETLATVAKVLLVFTLFIVGFALSFHILFADTYYFGSIGRSLMKTFIMMTGEFEYIDYFPTSISLMTLPYFIFALFVFIMPIILMNLLVGLAVGDIQRILENARLNRRKMRVQDLLPLQAFIVWVRSILPFKRKDLFYREKYNLWVNKRSIWRQFALLITGQGDQVISHDAKKVSEMERLKLANARLGRQVGSLEQKVKSLTTVMEQQLELIADICESHGIEFDHE